MGASLEESVATYGGPEKVSVKSAMLAFWLVFANST